MDALEPRSQMVLPAAPRASIRPGPGTKLLFFWSRAASQPGGLTGTMKARGQAQRQVAVSCLADVSPSLIEMHYHLAYRVAAGSLGSLVWRVPAGLVLESLQAPQLAGYRFVPGVDGARHLEIEFSKPQRGDFSLAAKFDYAVDQNQKQIFLPLVDPLSDDGGARGDAGLQFHQIAVRQPSESRVTVTAAHPGQSLKSRPVDEFLKEWNAGGARPQQAFELDRLFEVNLAIESLASVPAVHGSSIARFHPHRLDWTYTADVAPNSVPQFVYRLAVDPRARIKSISVLEDGAERLLRWSQVRDAVVLFLSDRATRAQTIRIDASLPLTGSPVIELPRARFPGAPPDRERVTIYRDDAVAVRFDNPDEAPPALPEDSAIGASREILVARVDLAPEQNPPRLVVEPVLPRISAETATIIEESGDAWRTTMCVAFHVAAGRATEFTLELPESSASRLAIRSVPESRVVSRPGPDGRVVLTFYPDEPVLDRFVAVLSGSIDRPRTPRQPPSIALPGVEQTATLLVAPTGILAPLPAGARSAAPIENWITQVVPEAAHAGFESYRLPAGGPLPELHPIGRQSLRTMVELARHELWIGNDGSIDGRLSLKFAGAVPAVVELDWPPTASPTALFVDGTFQALPVPADGRLEIPMPPGLRERDAWISWNDRPGSLPSIAGWLAARLPWPRALPIGSCRVEIYAPRRYRVEGRAPLIAVAATSEDQNLPAVLRGSQSEGDVPMRHTVMDVSPIPEPGRPFELGASLRIINERAANFGWTVAIIIPLALVLLWAGAWWPWIVQHETACWILLSIFWWLCLAPSWLGLVIAAWAIVSVRRRPAEAPAPAAASGIVPVE